MPKHDPAEAEATTGATPTRAAKAAHAGRGHATPRPWFKRLRVIGPAAAGVAAIAIGATALALQADPAPVAQPPPSASPTSAPSPTEVPLIVPTTQPDVNAATILSLAGDQIEVFNEPGGATAARTLSAYSYYAQPRTLLADQSVALDGEEWFHVLLPIQPNGSAGWVRASDVEQSATTGRVEIYLKQRKLSYFEDGEKVFSAEIAIGASKTPTPPGTYYVTDELERPNANSVYGAYILGLSGYSEVLKEFKDGPPQLAIHGTNQPWLLGEAISNGCIRLENKDVLKLAKKVGLGTPVVVMESRPKPDDAEETAPGPSPAP